MRNVYNKNINKLEHIIILYMIAGVVIFLFGPISWIDTWDFATIYGLFLIIMYIVAFAFGFKTKLKIHIGEYVETNVDKRQFNEQQVLNFLKFGIWIALLMTIVNALEYTGSSSLQVLLKNAISGISNPASAYYSKNSSSRSGSLISYANLLFQPIVYLSLVSAIYYFKKLKTYQRIIVAATVLIEALRWLAIGTNKGLLDVIFLFVSVYILKNIVQVNREKRTLSKKQKRKRYRTFFLIVVLFIVFLVFFNTTMNDRVDNYYDTETFSHFPYNLIPEKCRVFVEKIDSYFTQGYANFIKCIRYGEFKWTFGIGNSRFLLGVWEQLTGIDLFDSTYPGQLANYGIDPLAAWHSAYAWFASDITFFGVIFLMFIVGRYFASILQDSVVTNNPVSMTLFYFLLLGIINISCNNYVLAFVNTWSGFVVLSIIKIFKIRVTFNRKQLAMKRYPPG